MQRWRIDVIYAKHEKVMQRNLIYFICPFDGDEWRMNVDKLRPLLNVFNGKVIVTVAQGKGLAPVMEVRRAFGTYVDRIIWSEVQNNRNLGETPHFLPAMQLLASEDPDEITMYAHAKGVRYRRINPKRLNNIRLWRNVMYERLTDVQAVEQEFARGADCVGCFKRNEGKVGGLLTPWHYSGTFFWFRHSAVFSQNWEEIASNRFGVETYLSSKIPKENAGCLYADDLDMTVNNAIYDWPASRWEYENERRKTNDVRST